MALVCNVCGLPEDLCVCGTISSEQQKIKVRLEMRRYNKPTTIVEGVNPKTYDLSKIIKQLKTWCACGGSSKNGILILQGDHRDKMLTYLPKFGIVSANIEVL